MNKGMEQPQQIVFLPMAAVTAEWPQPVAELLGWCQNTGNTTEAWNWV